MKKIQAIRGMNDILPDRSAAWQYLEATMRDLFTAYGYAEIRTPVLEDTALFRRTIGEVTDIVEKEMYTFADRNGDSVTLRPEGTAGVVRAAMENGLLHNQIQRVWYTGPMFRYERPQKGRYRQFHQFGVEVFGLPGPDIDAELIIMTARLWRLLGISDQLTLEINTLGTPESRARYREALVAYLREHEDALDEDSKRRLESNPLRILDSKNENTRRILAGAPLFESSLDDESRSHFRQLLAALDQAGVSYVHNPHLVRGLDYYTRTVFEWTTRALGAQGTVLAGGRYDGLVEQLGGKSTPGIGFGMGVERLLLLLETLEVIPPEAYHQLDAYLVGMGEAAERELLPFAERLRDAVPGLRLQVHMGGGGFKSRMKKADRSGARYALIVGEDELSSQSVSVKDLRGNGEQVSLSWQDLGTLRQWLDNSPEPGAH